MAFVLSGQPVHSNAKALSHRHLPMPDTRSRTTRGANASRTLHDTPDGQEQAPAPAGAAPSSPTRSSPLQVLMDFFGSSPGVNVRNADSQPAALPRASTVAAGRPEDPAAAETLVAAEAPAAADEAAAHHEDPRAATEQSEWSGTELEAEHDELDPLDANDDDAAPAHAPQGGTAGPHEPHGTSMADLEDRLQLQAEQQRSEIRGEFREFAIAMAVQLQQQHERIGSCLSSLLAESARASAIPPYEAFGAAVRPPSSSISPNDATYKDPSPPREPSEAGLSEPGACARPPGWRVGTRGPRTPASGTRHSGRRRNGGRCLSRSWRARRGVLH